MERGNKGGKTIGGQGNPPAKITHKTQYFALKERALGFLQSL